MWLSKIPGNLQYWGMAIYTKNKYEGPIFPSVAQVKLKSSLLYGARTKLGYFEFASFNDWKYMVYDHFDGNGLYGKIPD